MTKENRVCNTCKGTGHDKAGRPVIVFRSVTTSQGRKRKQHVTKAQGSGCLKCLGTGRTGA